MTSVKQWTQHTDLGILALGLFLRALSESDALWPFHLVPIFTTALTSTQGSNTLLS